MRRLPPLAAVGLSLIALAVALAVAPYVTRAERPLPLHFRWPRVAFSACAGATLAVAGVVLQAVLRNPLATPYTLGISSGASLGAALAFRLGAAAGVASLPLALPGLGSLAGAAVSAAVVYGIARARSGELPAETLLLAGVAVSLLAGAAIATLQYLSDTPDLLFMSRWTLGALDVVEWSQLRSMAPLSLGGLAVLLLVARDLDVAALDDESARALGVDPVRVRRLAFAGASLATAGVVATAGPVAFVGLIVPHAARAIAGPDHRVTLPCSVLLGGAFLVACDVVARTVLYPTELPINIITSAIGCPTFIWILARRA